MPEIEKTDQPPPDAGHEDRDINVRAIIKFFGFFAIFAVVVHLLLAWQWSFFNEDISKTDRKLSPLAAKSRPKLPEDLQRIPEPRLQNTETHDITYWQKKENEILTGYQWINEKNKTVRIPIDRAIELLSNSDAASKRGIRVRAEKKKGS